MPYELGSPTTYDWTTLYPVYVRGQAHLAAHQATAAAAEFQKIIDHPGIVVNEPIGALAHLQLGRAYAMQGEPGEVCPMVRNRSAPKLRTHQRKNKCKECKRL